MGVKKPIASIISIISTQAAPKGQEGKATWHITYLQLHEQQLKLIE